MKRALKEQDQKAKAVELIAIDNTTTFQPEAIENPSSKPGSHNQPPHPIKPLNVHMYDCGYPIPPDQTLDGYTGLKTTDCSYCADVCEAPSIDATVHFFAGFEANEVKWIYLGALGFTILW